MTEPLLVVLNPRQIAECIAAISELDIRRAWLTGFPECELGSIFGSLLDEIGDDCDPWIVISDDGVPRQHALDAVLALYREHPVVTGYSNLAREDLRVNLQRVPLTSPTPTLSAYDLYHLDEALAYPERAIPTFFAGMCLTAMSAALWRKFPFRSFGAPPGGGSDYSLSWRLQEAGVPIVAARDAFVWHAKERWSLMDTEPRKRLMVGMVEPEIRVDAPR